MTRIQLLLPLRRREDLRRHHRCSQHQWFRPMFSSSCVSHLCGPSDGHVRCDLGVCDGCHLRVASPLVFRYPDGRGFSASRFLAFYCSHRHMISNS